MSITIDNNSGFCFGVTRAIKTAESELKNGPLFCLGDIVHNGEEVARLERLGLETIDYDDLRTLRSGRVLLRAHGEPPSTYRIARDNGLEIIDASCPVVLQLQKKIRETYQSNPDAQIVIFGKPGHAEVIGLQGQTGNTAFVVQSPADLDRLSAPDAHPRLDFSRPIFLFSQTTMAVDDYHALADAIRNRLSVLGSRYSNTRNPDPGTERTLQAYDTICRNVANRVENLRQFAREHDLVIFVGGRKSSNAQVLFEHCRDANPRTLFVSSPDELTPETFSLCGLVAERVGICGATSTPLWLMEACRDRIEELAKKL
jgi:4-hydroxy-3-methylbut-2-enyl diphosphate reductase